MVEPLRLRTISKQRRLSSLVVLAAFTVVAPAAAVAQTGSGVDGRVGHSTTTTTAPPPTTTVPPRVENPSVVTTQPPQRVAPDWADPPPVATTTDGGPVAPTTGGAPVAPTTYGSERPTASTTSPPQTGPSSETTVALQPASHDEGSGAALLVVGALFVAVLIAGPVLWLWQRRARSPST